MKDRIASSSISSSTDSSSSKPILHWLLERLQAQDAIISKAAELQLQKDTKHKLTTATILTSHLTNDFVLVEYPSTGLKSGPPSKLMTNLRGPMKVISKDKEGLTYQLQDLVTFQTEKVHVKRIHPFYYDPIQTDPRQVANVDKQTWDVDKILSHKGNPNKTSTLQFKVLWKSVNNTPAEVTWEPYSNLRTTAALHLNLTNHKMKKLIPPQYKN